MAITAGLRDHLRIPLFRNGYALVGNAFATSAVGVLYWVIAARQYTAEDLGVNSAMISAMIFLSNLGQLNLTNALNRFVPRAGSQTPRLILGSYGVAFAVSVVVGVVFVVGVGLWTPRLEDLQSDPLLGLAFVAGIALWSLFALQDSALTGLRSAVWVPISNLVFALLKILLLVVLGYALPRYGILASWVFPLVFLIVPVNVLIFRHLVPRRADAQDSEDVSAREVARYAAGDYSASLIWTATRLLMPLVVLERAGAEEAAYYYLAWTISYSLYLVSRNMGQSLITEGALRPELLRSYLPSTAAQTLRLLVPAVAAVVVLAPVILSLFGSDYSEGGTTLLRLLALAAIPNVFTAMFVSVARVERRVGSIVAVYAALAAMVVPLAILLLGQLGIAGIGLAWLIAESVMALALLATRLRGLWEAGPVGALVDRLMGPGLQRLRSRREQIPARVLEDMLPTVARQIPGLETANMRLVGVAATAHGTTVADLEGGSKDLVFRTTRLDSARRGFAAHEASLISVHRLGVMGGLLPEVLGNGSVDGYFFAVETRLRGVNAAGLNGDSDWIPPAAIAAILPLHVGTGDHLTIGTSEIDRWITEPAYTIRKYSPRPPAGLEELSARLAAQIAHRRLHVSVVHGDYWPGNILVEPSTQTVTGIIDWENSRPNMPSVLDGIQFAASWVALQRGMSLGEVFVAFSNAETDVRVNGFGYRSYLGSEALPDRALAQLAWLHHVDANLRKSERYRTSARWFETQVHSVLGRWES